MMMFVVKFGAVKRRYNMTKNKRANNQMQLLLAIYILNLGARCLFSFISKYSIFVLYNILCGFHLFLMEVFTKTLCASQFVLNKIIYYIPVTIVFTLCTTTAAAAAQCRIQTAYASRLLGTFLYIGSVVGITRLTIKSAQCACRARAIGVS